MRELTRRRFVQAGGVVAAAGLLGAAPAPRRRLPNVLLIVSDDQGYADVGCYGSKDLATPNLDGLARRGVRFTQFYAGSSVCSPSRASILTGLCPQRAGVPGNAPSQPGGGGMRTDVLTMAQMLKQRGYATAHIGKWHLGYSKPTMPNARGFDYSFGHMGGCIDNYSHYFYWQGPNRHDLHRNGVEVFHEGQYFGDLMVSEASGFMQQNQDRPFFMYWASNKPHYPLQGTAKWRAHYKDLPQPRCLYAAMVSTLDEEIGRLLSKLDELKLTEETIVIFQSDQGHSLEDRSFGGGGDAGPYRGAKGSLFEGGIRIPAIISWPGHLPENESRGQMCTGCDWLATVGELTGATVPESLDGRSLLPVVRSPDARSQHEVFHWALGNRWAVRQGPWKLLGNPGAGLGRETPGDPNALFLANIDLDPSESQNQAERQPDVVRRLKSLHEQWAGSHQ